MPNITTLSIPTRYGEIVAEDTSPTATGADATNLQTLLFLHGGAANLRSWDGVIAALKRTRCIAIDLPGHGKTLIDPLTFDELAGALRDLLGYLKIHQPILIGHSFGGLAAVVAGSLNGDLYGGVMAVDPRLSNAEIRQTHSTLAKAMQELKDMTWPWLEVVDLDAEVERCVESMTRREDIAQLRAMVRRGYRMQGKGHYVRFPRREDEMKGVEANWSVDVDNAYRTVGCPLALALAGQDERHLAQRNALVESLARHRTVGNQVFDCGHDIPGYQPGALASYISGWMAQLN